ncbi:MAG: hypothetical protein AUG51_18095 [Acidobacteria bacterium 13_1_20CM_3_53_8]|nr:MAG: hypothetical protein AUG51_18095 [Acidobacteria bacterium 13_1_20CM_3_53_8]
MGGSQFFFLSIARLTVTPSFTLSAHVLSIPESAAAMKLYELTDDEIALIEASRAGSMLELTPEVGCYETKL